MRFKMFEFWRNPFNLIKHFLTLTKLYGGTVIDFHFYFLDLQLFYEPHLVDHFQKKRNFV